MMDRALIWYVFGLAAVATILLRWKPTLRGNWREPVAVSFSIGIFFSVFGVLSKQPVLAQGIDALTGPNTAWLLADSFFLIGLWGLTTWIDLMRAPGRTQGHLPIYAGRTITLLIVIVWMGLVAWVEAPAWQGLERGGIDVGGKLLLLSGRMAYLTYDIWGLAYLGRRFFQLRQQLRERVSYLRLTLAWMAVSLAAIAPALQILAVIAVFFQPERLPVIWPPVWQVVSLLQMLVAALILTLFFEPAYRLLVWLDKRRLIRQLRRLQQTISAYRPELVDLPKQTTSTAGQETEPDLVLASLVNELEVTFSLMGATADRLLIPAGKAMSRDLRGELERQKQRFRVAMTQRQSFDAPIATGDSYILARWYAHFSSLSLPLS
jgi:hypothetical protein